jgi:ABC-2 type transport system ATP-binding protein
MSTHLIDEAERMDRVLMMHDGRIVADGSPQELRRGVGSQRITVNDSRWKPAAGDTEGWRETGGGVWLRDLSSDDAAPRIAQQLAAATVAFSIAPPSLADAYERLTGSRLDGDSGSEVAA